MRHNWHHVIEEIQPPLRNYVVAAVAATYREAEAMNFPAAMDQKLRSTGRNNLVAWINSWRFKQYVESIGRCADQTAYEIYEVMNGRAVNIRALLQEQEALEKELDKKDDRRWARVRPKSPKGKGGNRAKKI